MTALGIVLLTIGTIAVVVEAHVPSLGMMAGPGTVALAVGAVLAVSGLGGGLALSVVAALALAAVATGVSLISIRQGMAVRRRRIRTGSEAMIGRIGSVRNWSGHSGMVLVDGALWRARRSWHSGEEELHPGDPVVVEYLHGLTLTVRPAEDWELVA